MTTLLSLDPSSTSCGVAHFPSIDGRNPQPDFLHVIRPGNLPADDRISFIVEGVLILCRRFLPDCVAIERSSGHQAGRKSGRMRGLSTMGFAQGRVYQAVLDLQRYRTSRFDPDRIDLVSESDWTYGTPKDKRALIVAAACHLYRDFLEASSDGSWRGMGEWKGTGLDAADAAGIGLWWAARHKIEVMVNATDGGR